MAPSGLSATSLKGGFFLDGSKSGTGQENFWDWVATMVVIKAIAPGDFRHGQLEFCEFWVWVGVSRPSGLFHFAVAPDSGGEFSRLASGHCQFLVAVGGGNDSVEYLFRGGGDQGRDDDFSPEKYPR